MIELICGLVLCLYLFSYIENNLFILLFEQYMHMCVGEIWVWIRYSKGFFHYFYYQPRYAASLNGW